MAEIVVGASARERVQALSLRDIVPEDADDELTRLAEAVVAAGPLWTSVIQHLCIADPDSTAEHWRAGVVELARFLCIKAQRRDWAPLLLSPSGEVDVVWHQAVLSTRRYAALCGDLGGFIEHDPDGALPENHAAQQRRYGSTLAAYEAAFSTPSPWWWPPSSEAPTPVRTPASAPESAPGTAHTSSQPLVAVGKALVKKFRANSPNSLASELKKDAALCAAFAPSGAKLKASKATWNKPIVVELICADGAEPTLNITGGYQLRGTYSALNLVYTSVDRNAADPNSRPTQRENHNSLIIGNDDTKLLAFNLIVGLILCSQTVIIAQEHLLDYLIGEREDVEIDTWCVPNVSAYTEDIVSLLLNDELNKASNVHAYINARAAAARYIMACTYSSDEHERNDTRNTLVELATTFYGNVTFEEVMMKDKFGDKLALAHRHAFVYFPTSAGTMVPVRQADFNI